MVFNNIPDKTSNVWDVFRACRAVFSNQMDQTLEIKVRSVKHVLERDFPTYYSFGEDLSSVTDNLCDSKRFTKECEDLNLNPIAVSQHILFAGQKVYNHVRDFGVKATFGPRVSEFNNPLFEVVEFKK